MKWGPKTLRSLGESAPTRTATTRFALDDLPATMELYGGEQLVRHARTVAAGHTVRTAKAPERLLRLLDEDERVIRASHRAAAAALSRGARPGPAAEWLLDNFYLIEEQIHLSRRHLPRGFSRQLPRLIQGPRAGLPRVYDIATELILHTDGRFDADDLGRFIQAYQTVAILRLGELWAVPIMLRLALVHNLRRIAERVAARQDDRDLAEYWAARFLEIIKTRPNHVIVPLGELVKSSPTLSRPFVVELATRLQGQHAALGMVLSWLDQELSDRGQTLEHVMQVESQDISGDQAAIANSISGLRALSATDWPAFVETHSVVETWLRHDPPGVYAKMDFKTRDRYRHVVERLAKHANLTEQEIAQQTVVLAKQAAPPAGGNGNGKSHAPGRVDHVGYYLIAEGRPALEKVIGYRRPLLQFLRHTFKIYVGPIYAAAILFLTAAVALPIANLLIQLDAGVGVTVAAVVAVILLASQTAIAVINWLGTTIVPPRGLPRMNFEKGIPPEAKSVVVVPNLLTSRHAVKEMIDLLEVRFLANHDPQLAFALLTDFTDAPSDQMPTDGELLDYAAELVRTLNRRYSPDRDMFFLFHRPRLWNPAEGVWMGRERKRGKIADFSRFLLEKDGSAFSRTVGDLTRLDNTHYIIVLDADTQLPPLAAWKLVGTMAHPLNRAVIDPQTHRVVDGYGVLQPRTSVGLTTAHRSRYSRLFAGEAGLDPYSGEVSDVYQDLFEEASFVGKGIIDPRVFQACTDDRFPDNTILSHDLIEGCFARCGFVADVELVEDAPSQYVADMNRQQRWVRGDWQIAPWLSPRPPVPAVQGKKTHERNRLSWLSQWKILDNLRRSLLSLAAITLILLDFFRFTSPITWALITLGFMLVPVLVRTVHAFFFVPQSLSIRSNTRRLARREGVATAQVLLWFEFLPYQALQTLDAILKVMWRKTVTHKHLLEWLTSTSAEQAARRDMAGLFRTMWVCPAMALVVLASTWWHPQSWPLAVVVAVAWALAPVLAWRLSQPLVHEGARITGEEAAFLGRIARRTWRYFEQFNTERTSWLTPDNYQEKPVERLAERTSPTNIGLGLLADLAAWDFGYATAGAVTERIGKTVATLGKLERYRGHFFNWYDTRTLTPLSPRYVSSVDSGNLAVSLVVLRVGLKELMTGPILQPRWLRGLRDTLGVLREEIAATLDNKLEPAGVSNLVQLKRAIDDLLARLAIEPATWPAGDAMVSEMVEAAQRLRHQAGATGGEVQWWLDTFQAQCDGLRDELVTLCPWRAISESDLHLLGQSLLKNGVEMEAITALQAALRRAPTLEDLARFNDQFGRLLATLSPAGCHGLSSSQAVSEESGGKEKTRFAEDGQTVAPSQTVAPAAVQTNNTALSPTLNTWLNLVREHAKPIADLAARRLDTLNALHESCTELSTMDFRFLFDPKRKLFSIGFTVDHHRLDASHYDLFASEARMTSFYAIAFGQVPYEHWFMLGRSLTPSDGSVSLVSWSGAMFEYLMPMLMMPSYPGTLMEEACRGAVNAQIQYGRERGVPWGISESGYNLVDAQLNYQYRAFGVPSLGLKRGLSDDLVIAPYAAAMATMIDPSEAYRNLRDMVSRGFRGACGFYEAIDYTTKRVPDGEAFAIVRSFMAHHSGMALLSLAYTLLDRPNQRRFLTIPEFRSTLILTQERMPATDPNLIASEYQAGSLEGPTDGADAQTAARVLTRPDPVTPQVALLSNGRYNVMLTDAGSGYSNWKDIALTRWRTDRTLDNWGSFIYIHDLDRNIHWSVAQQPDGRGPDRYEAIFAQGKVEYRRHDGDVETYTQIAVSPEDDAEVRRVRITNLSRARRRFEVTTYSEVVLAGAGADMAHRAFSNLFVQTELQPASSAVLATRRPRSSGETPPWLVHLTAVSEHKWQAPSFETDRAKFLGRGRSASNPVAMDKSGPLSGTAGAVLDPIVSIRRMVELGPGESAEIDSVMGVAATQAAAHALIDRYKERKFVTRVFETAWTQSQVLMQQLGASEADAQLFNRLAGALIFGDPSLRAPASMIARNRKGQPSLWGYAISGDLPIVVVTITEAGGMDLVTKLIQAHAWWRNRGLRTDLVILIEEAAGYRMQLMEQVTGVLATSGEAQLVDKPGGVFVRGVENMPEDDRVLLQAVARLTFNDRGGNLYDQADRITYDPPRVPRFQPSRQGASIPPAPLPARELLFTNGLGGFTRDGREYVINLDAGKPTPAPWVNVLANGIFGTVVSESGSAYTWFENAHEFRLTPWNNDPVSDTGGESLYIRDEGTGRFWSPTPLPARGRGPYTCRHGLGYTAFEHDEEGVFTETTMFVAYDAPVKFALVRLQNHTAQTKRMTVWGCYDWVLGELRDKTQSHVVTKVDPRTGAVFASSSFNPDFATRVCFAHCYPTDRTFTGDRVEFFGRNGSPANPAALGRQRLSNRSGAALDPCAALQCTIDVPPGQERHVVMLLGAARSEREALDLLGRYRGVETAKQALQAACDFWKKMLGAVYVETPDPALDILLNHWSLYQVIACRLWGRSGYYQSGGAYGFRDQLQDTLALLHAAPWLLREQLITCSAHQFREGDVQHWWHPPTGRGVRTAISDDYLWLPYAVCRYVAGTGDTGVLDHETPFLDARPLKEHEESYYDLPKISDEKGTVYNHCVRAIRRGLRYGSHGLPLIGAGDWNDGMNRVGAEGKGESVWLAFFLYDVAVKFAEVADSRNDTGVATECRVAAEHLKSRIEAEAWDGEWYRRAYFDDGTPLGSAANAECQIDSISQSWAVISGAAATDRATQAMAAVSRRLVRDDLKLIQLFDPPFDKSPLDPGYVKGYVPGVRENGAQYTHAAVWAAMAFGQLGDVPQLWRCYSHLNPINHARNGDEVSVYKVEPYVIAADIYTNPAHMGRGGWTWYTGSAGWMHRLMLETMLGLRIDVDKLRFAPRVPPEWKSFRVHYRYRETFYHINVNITGPETTRVRRVIADGVENEEKVVPMVDDHGEHNAEVEVG